jgi:ubiquinone/menaquinone biosynthesis C-methylase UbiE
MGQHTFDVQRAAILNDPSRYRFISREELLSTLDFIPSKNTTVTIADIGSGTGFFTDTVALYADQVFAIDVQSEMHEQYRTRGCPQNVSFITAEAGQLPLDDAALDCCFSTMTYHEFGRYRSIEELARVVRTGGRVVTFDWAQSGMGEAGPPCTERYGLSHVIERFSEAGLKTIRAETRTETFVHVAKK